MNVIAVLVPALVAPLTVVMVVDIFGLWPIRSTASPDHPGECAQILRRVLNNDGWVNGPELSDEEDVLCEKAYARGYLDHDGHLGTGYVLTRKGRAAAERWCTIR